MTRSDYNRDPEENEDMDWYWWLLLLLVVGLLVWWFFRRSAAGGAAGSDLARERSFDADAGSAAEPIVERQSVMSPTAPSDVSTTASPSSSIRTGPGVAEPPPAEPTGSEPATAKVSSVDPAAAPEPEPVKAATPAPESPSIEAPEPKPATPDMREPEPSETPRASRPAEGPYGGGSATAEPDGSGPAGWAIKGNADSMKYHTTESPYYGRTKAEVWFETEERARGAGFARWDEGRADTGVQALAEVPPGPFGAGSAAAGEDGSGPEGWAIKGNEDSMLYHTTESQYYGRTKAEVWFQSEEAAQKAGFRRWDAD